MGAQIVCRPRLVESRKAKIGREMRPLPNFERQATIAEVDQFRSWAKLRSRRLTSGECVHIQ